MLRWYNKLGACRAGKNSQPRCSQRNKTGCSTRSQESTRDHQGSNVIVHPWINSFQQKRFRITEPNNGFKCFFRTKKMFRKKLQRSIAKKNTPKKNTPCWPNVINVKIFKKSMAFHCNQYPGTTHLPLTASPSPPAFIGCHLGTFHTHLEGSD